ncbi:MAG: prepilin-type N-terminal cleavage/methylation domain-containing protein [Clostridia bacterium]|nr:prepilin-type N-terminal cleavage/methylation domain-containing protein [Clostridia bacterium]
MNKKGFSLMELMIVVVIMGILIAIAIPLYGAITTNAKNSTCESNLDTIRSAAVAYSNGTGMTLTVDNWKDVLEFDGGEVPKCPWGEGAETYEVTEITDDGEAIIVCNATHLED